MTTKSRGKAQYGTGEPEATASFSNQGAAIEKFDPLSQIGQQHPVGRRA